jgi:hypothetical protein
VDLWAYYQQVETLIGELRSAGHEVEAGEVGTAVRGGATSGEILGRLTVALPAVAARVPELRNTAAALADWAAETLHRDPTGAKQRAVKEGRPAADR